MSTVQQIKNEMIAVKENETALAGLTSTSKVSIWLHLLYIVAVCVGDLKQYFSSHRTYIDERLANQKSGTLPWYRSMALAFQYGFDLITDTDTFDNNNADEQAIEDSKIIKYAAVNEGDKPGTIVIKVATEESGKLAILTPEAETSVKQYFKEIGFAGDRITIINHLADKLFLNIRIYIDPLVLEVNGMSKLNGNKPVEEALQEFMKELPFNGEMLLQSMVDKLQVVEGVKVAHLVEIKSSSLDAVGGNHGTPQVIEVSKIPLSGYFEIETFDNINYVV
ncbi:nucleotidyltransferase [Tenacibaculum haliotis]|uniref:nucleotidyltransferase n=1 Tax=Tenacibaculum haliotis TaxID=1888914 RepID=UPI0021AFFA7E|nr:nucleotidyltransferase [Tenacibaculum haliotis]MCT4698090.1 nucleotidyltransferase [Tenacibaculum haliotis]